MSNLAMVGLAGVFYMLQVCSLNAEEVSISSDTPAKVRIENNTIFYRGDVSQASWKAFKYAIANGAITDVRKIVINSGGGDTQYGRKLGSWVFEQNLIVEVEGGCFSSCANYVFPAGRKKVIRQGAFVGWHGSEAQWRIMGEDPISKSMEAKMKERLRSQNVLSRPELAGTEELKKLVEHGWRLSIDGLKKSLDDEDRFFEKLGLENTFTIYGDLPEHRKNFENSGKKGWTFSLEDMEQFGITNVQYLGSKTYETEPNVLKNMIVFTLKQELQ
ncbi:MAG: hypothetical protein GY877_03080 [Hyphomicrobium sp.]|nr:hypothetical protein [Hyphomicrobium sp.]